MPEASATSRAFHASLNVTSLERAVAFSMAQVTNDAGHVFRRGESVALNVHDWQALSKTASADFLPLAPQA